MRLGRNWDSCLLDVSVPPDDISSTAEHQYPKHASSRLLWERTAIKKSQSSSSWLPGGRHWLWGKKAVSFQWPSGGLCSAAGCRAAQQSWAEESLLGHVLGGWLCVWCVKEVKWQKKEERLKGATSRKCSCYPSCCFPAQRAKEQIQENLLYLFFLLSIFHSAGIEEAEA